MAEATNELLFRTLQQVQETLADHTRRFERIERSIEELRTTSATSLGFAMHANLRHETAGERMDEVSRRLGSLDDLKRRVEVLEQAK